MKNKFHVIFLGLAFLIGLAARVIQYFGAPAMWKDELFSVINIENMSMLDLLTKQPEWNQVAGVGFYIIQKSMLLISGIEHEMVYRLYPFITSVLAMWVFYLIARKFLQGTLLVASVFLFVGSLSPWLHSSNAKPYSGDLLFVMLFVWFMLVLQDRGIKNWQYWLAGLIGFVGTIASIPTTVFAFGAIVFLIWKHHESISIRSLVPCFLLWILGSGWNIYYTNVIIDNSVVDAMQIWHENRFPPSTGFLEFIYFYPKQLANNLGEFITFGYDAFSPFILSRSIILFILVVLALVLSQKKNYSRLIPLLLPVLMALALATLYLYPFLIRTSIYSIWPLLILAFIGLQQLAERTKWFKTALANVVGILIVLPSTLFMTMILFILPFAAEPVKKALNYYQENKQDGDILFVHGNGDLYMEYYGPKLGVEDYVLGKEDDVSLSEYSASLDSLTDRTRVWYYFVGHRPEMQPELSVDDIKNILDEHGLLIDEYSMMGGYPTFINLYDFSGSGKSQ